MVLEVVANLGNQRYQRFGYPLDVADDKRSIDPMESTTFKDI